MCTDVLLYLFLDVCSAGEGQRECWVLPELEIQTSVSPSFRCSGNQAHSSGKVVSALNW